MENSYPIRGCNRGRNIVFDLFFSFSEIIAREPTKTCTSKQAGANVREASREPPSDRAQKQAWFRGPSCIVREMAAAEYIKDVAVGWRLEGFDAGSLGGQCNVEGDVTWLTWTTFITSLYSPRYFGSVWNWHELVYFVFIPFIYCLSHMLTEEGWSSHMKMF